MVNITQLLVFLTASVTVVLQMAIQNKTSRSNPNLKFRGGGESSSMNMGSSLNVDSDVEIMPYDSQMDALQPDVSEAARFLL